MLRRRIALEPLCEIRLLTTQYKSQAKKNGVCRKAAPFWRCGTLSFTAKNYHGHFMHPPLNAERGISSPWPNTTCTTVGWRVKYQDFTCLEAGFFSDATTGAQTTCTVTFRSHDSFVCTSIVQATADRAPATNNSRVGLSQKKTI